MPARSKAASTSDGPDYDPKRAHTYGSISGHTLLIELFKFMLAEGRLPHAMLLHGPSGIGKTSLAWIFAKEILWAGFSAKKRDEGGEALKKRLVSRVARGVHPDALHLAPAGQQIRIDQVREIAEDRATASPVEGRYKVLVIESAEAMNASSANSLLKLLEEPPSFLRFILITDSPHSMLPTIRSRCSAMACHPLNEEELMGWLRFEEPDAEQEQLDRIVRLAEGRPARAQALLNEVDRMPRVEAIMRDFDDLGFAGVFKAANDLTGLAPNNFELLQLLLLYYRQKLTALFADNQASPEQLSEEARREAATITAACNSIIDEINSGRNLNHRELHMEALLCRIGRAMREVA